MRIKPAVFGPAILAFCILTVAGCGTTPGQGGGVDRRSPLDPPVIGGPDALRPSVVPPASPRDVTIRPARDGDGEEINRVRSAALQEAAQSWGSQMGFARRSWEVAGRLEAHSANLSTVFDFNRVVSTAPSGAGVVIPPVVSRSFNAFVSSDDGREASVADEYLTIVRPGRLSPVEPTWRDYLLFAAPDPEEPARSLMPADREELRAFQKWFEEGWEEGVKLADAELQSRLDRLKQDFTGMLQYRRLVSQGMMDRMVLADADFGVTVDGAEMRIGSRTVRIVSDAQFQGNPQRWSLRSVGRRDALVVETGEFPPSAASLF